MTEYADWSDGQRGLDGSEAVGQARFDGAKSDPESVVESVDNYNSGGLMADTRDDPTRGSGDDEDDEPVQGTLSAAWGDQ